MSADYDVAIVGAGPCGLLSALLLARRGIRCAVYERRAALLAHPKAMGISRRSAEIFRQVRLLEALRSEDLPPPEYALALWEESLVGEQYGRVPLPVDDPEVVPFPVFHCPQTKTERALLAALEAEDNASILFDHEVTALDEEADVVRLTAQRTGNDAPYGPTARYVIAADGAGGSVRRQLGIDAVGPGDLGHFLNVFFRAPYGPLLGGRRAVLHQILRADLFEVFVAVNGRDEWLMHHFLQPGESPADFPPERLAEIVKDASGRPDIPVEILGASPWVMSPKVAAQFRRGRVFLTGDASARLSPAAGLGMNTGLQSAHNLAWKLAAVLRGAPASLLDSYDAERRGQIMRTFETSNEFGSEVWDILNAGFADDFARVRDLVAHSRRGQSGLGLDLGWRYERGAFLAETDADDAPLDPNVYRPTAEPGRRAPHLRLAIDGAPCSTLDLFGHGFALLVAGDATPWRAALAADATFGGYPLEIVPIGSHGIYADPTGRFGELYGVGPGGAVLVRPDGVVAWRSPGADPTQLAGVLATVLAGG